MRIIRILITALPLAAAACAAPMPNWVNVALPKDQWPKDYAECRRWSEDQIDPAYSEPMDSRSSDPFRQMDRAQNKKQSSAMTAYCMTERGYVKKPEAKR